MIFLLNLQSDMQSVAIIAERGDDCDDYAY